MMLPLQITDASQPPGDEDEEDGVVKVVVAADLRSCSNQWWSQKFGQGSALLVA
ncbi:hypothetical protein LINPERPRIM_LOCUS5098 [Linum perenne]